MEAPRALLRLMAWLSPAFPTGAFAYSHGLEWAVEAGDICNDTCLAAWLTDILTVGSRPPRHYLAAPRHRAAAEPVALREIADLAHASAASRERQSESLDQGKAFMLAGAAGAFRMPPERIPYPVAVGAAAGAHGIPEDATAAAFLQASPPTLFRPPFASCRWARPPACGFLRR